MQTKESTHTMTVNMLDVLLIWRIVKNINNKKIKIKKNKEYQEEYENWE